MRSTLTVLLAGFTLLVNLAHSEVTSEMTIECLTIQTSGIDASLRGLKVCDDQHAWVSGSHGTVIRTTDGGTTWQRIAVPESEELDFRDIAWLGPLNDGVVLLLAAGPGDKSKIFRSSDSGKTWQITLANKHQVGFFNAFSFADERTGYLIGDPIEGRLDLYRTDDGGVSWQSVAGPEMKSGEYGFAASGSNVLVVDPQRLFVATGGSVARVLRSVDAGVSWQSVNTPITSGHESSGIFSIASRPAAGSQHLVIVGGDYQNPTADAGNVAWSSDEGHTWQLSQPQGEIPHKACVKHLIGTQWLTIGRTGIAWSQDDGRTWQTVSQESFYTCDYDPATGVGWMAGAEGRVAKFKLP